MKKIIYIHGLGGAKETSHTYSTIKKNMKDVNVLSPEVPHNPLKALKWIDEYLNEEKPDLVIGMSMGGFVTLCNNKNINTLVINPAMNGYEDIINAFGMNYKGEFDPGRSDGKKEFILDKEYYNDLKIATKKYNDLIENNKINIKNIRGVFSKNDEYFHHKIDYERLYNDKCVLIDDMHSLNDDSIIKYVIPYINELLK